MEILNLFSGLEEEVGLPEITMEQSIQEAVEKVPGLTYIANFVTKDEERELLKHVDSESWSTQWQRRIQYYGRRYTEGPLHGDDEYPVCPLPAWAGAVSERLVERGVLETLPNQIGVNEYLPGQGISPHIDYFGGTVVSLSLGSGCVMNFTKIDDTALVSLWLEPRSIVVLKNQARHEWKHGIARRQKDVFQGQTLFRSRRVSVTFRDLVEKAH